MNIEYRTGNVEGRSICAELQHWLFLVRYSSFSPALGRFINYRAAREFRRHEEDQRRTLIYFAAKEINEEIAAAGIGYCAATACCALTTTTVIAVAASSSCLGAFVANCSASAMNPEP